jgi:hypothetical protein
MCNCMCHKRKIKRPDCLKFRTKAIRASQRSTCPERHTDTLAVRNREAISSPPVTEILL